MSKYGDLIKRDLESNALQATPAVNSVAELDASAEPLADMPKPNPESKYGALIARDLNATQSSVYHASQEDPANASEAVRLGNKLGQPPSVVASDIQSFKTEEKRADWANTLKAHPQLNELMQDMGLAARAGNDAGNINLVGATLNDKGFFTASQQLRKQQDEQQRDGAIREIVSATQLDYNQAEGLFESVKATSAKMREAGSTNEQIDAAISSTLNRYGNATMREPTRQENFRYDHPNLSTIVSGVAGYTGGAFGVGRIIQDAVDPYLKAITGYETSEVSDIGEIQQFFSGMAENYSTALQRDSFEQAYAKGEGMEWIGTQVLANAPSIVGSGVAVMSKTLAPVMLNIMGGVAAGGVYGDLINQGYDKSVALAAGVASGWLEKAFERLPIKAADEMRASWAGLAPEARADFAQRMMHALSLSGVMAGTESLEEGGTTLTQNIVESLSGALQAQVGGATAATDKAMSKNIFDDVIGSMLVGAAASGVHSPLLIGQTMLYNEAKIEAIQAENLREAAAALSAQNNAQTLEALSNIAASSDMVKNGDTEAYAQFLQKMTGQAGVETVYLPANELLQLAGPAAETMFPSVAGKLTDAAARGQRVEIPASEFILATREGYAATGTTVPAGVGAQLRQIASTELYGMSAAEAEQFFATGAQELQAKVDAINAGATDVQIQDVVEVTQNVGDQLKATGMFTPTQVKYYTAQRMAFYTTMAQRAGMTVKEMYAKDGYMLKLQAESGVPSMADSYDQDGGLITDTPQFKNWFGESKVRDVDGRPLVVYHGTAAEFDTFDLSERGRGSGAYNEPAFFFTSSPKTAAEFAKDAGRNGGSQSVMPVYLSMQNPMVVTRETHEADYAYDGSYDANVFSSIIVDAIEAGHDGVIFKRVSERGVSDQYAVFDSARIKSTMNSGQFNPNDPNILNQSAKKVDTLQMVAERGERIVGTRASISTLEKVAIKESSERIGVSVAEITRAVREHKLANPPAQGWFPLTYVRTVIDDGKVVHEYKKEPYTFSLDRDGDQLKPGTSEYEARVKAVGRAMHDEVLRVYERAIGGDKNAQNILAQAGWYKEMRERLRHEFGGLGDLFADLLGATSPNTPVRENWKNAVDVLRRATRGDYDELMPKWEKWADNIEELETSLEAWFNENLATGMTKAEVKKLPEYSARLDVVKAARKLSDDLLPTKESGKKYGFNGRNAVRAMIDLWRVVKNQNADIGRGSTAPKALNFSGNLIGFRERATIDVWAARMLQRLAGGMRIPSMAETGVSGAMREDASTTLQFGFGQDVFTEASKRIRNDKVMKEDKSLSEMNDDDLQAVVWFVEKELWTVNNWTNTAGEGGSFELEASLSGSKEQKRINELRKIIDSSKTKAASKANAKEELATLERTVDRFVGGLSIQMAADTQGIDYVPTDADMARLGEQIRLAIYEGDEKNIVLGSKALSTEGRYGGQERSLDIEVVAREGYDANVLWKRMLESAQAAKQDSTFLSRVLRTNEDHDPLYHRPGIEIYFREAASREKLEAILLDLKKEGVEFLTVVVDGRRMNGFTSGAMPAAVGVRLQYVPEFEQRYGMDNLTPLTDDQLRDKVLQRARELNDIAKRVSSSVDGVSFSGAFWYETQVAFSHEYQEKIDGITTGVFGVGAGETSERGYWSGQSIRSGLASADRQSQEGAGLDEGGRDVLGRDEEVYNQQGNAGGGARLRVSGAEVGARYGQAQEGSVSVVGVHYSGSKRDSLSGDKYGSGMPGAESRRVQNSFDDRLRKRIHFYVDEGNGVQPESGVGQHVHAIHLDNLYDAKADPLGLVDQAPGDANKMETLILDAGFDGYYVNGAQGQQGVAVLLGGHNVAPSSLGTHQEAMGYAQTFYSPLSQAFVNAKQSAMPGNEWAKWLKSNQAKLGLKADEIEWSGLNEYLELRGKNKVPRDDIVQFLNDNGIKLETKTLGGDKSWTVFNGMDGEYHEFPNEDAARAYADANGVSGASVYPSEYRKDGTKFHTHWAKQFTNGVPDTYREVLVKIPSFGITRPATFNEWADSLGDGGMPSREGYDVYLKEHSEGNTRSVGDFNSNHWKEDPNVIVHLRYDEIIGKDGKRYLRVGEIQSDWGQKGREDGFIDPKQKAAYEVAAKAVSDMRSELEDKYGHTLTSAYSLEDLERLDDLIQTEFELENAGTVPAAPFVTDTKLWVALGIKQAIKIAAEKGVDGIVFGTGQQNADMYDLSKQVSSITATRLLNGKYSLSVDSTDGEPIFTGDVDEKEMADTIGKEMAEKIIKQKTAIKEYTDLDLKVGGEGMRKFYDQIVPQVANTVLKQLGAGKTTKVALGTEAKVSSAYNGEKWGVTSNGEYVSTEKYDTQAEANAAAAEYKKSLGAVGFEITPELQKLAESGLPLYQDQQVSRGTFSPSTGVTKLTHAANLSTFLHESGHQYLEIMADLASQPDAAPGIMADMQTILDWMGVPDLATWNAMSLEEKRPHHENWAETFETYLYTGKAPSTTLKEAFKAFAGWLRKIYGQIRGDVAPEIRGVMDRMLASEAEIENANKRIGEALFATAESAGMTDEQWLDHKADERERVEAAIEQHQRRRLRDLKWLDNAKTKAMRKLQREAKELRAGVRAEVEREVSALPVYRAGEYIRYGKIIGDDGAESTTDQPHKLSIEALTDMYAGTTMGSMGLQPAKWEILGKGKRGMLAEDGLHPDMIAGSFGYESGDAMIRALVEAPPMRELVKTMTDERMMDEHAEMATPEAIEDSATEALHNDAHLKFLATEHTALANLIGARKVPLSAIKQAAKESLGSTKIVDIKPHVYVQAERRAAKAAEKAMREGNLQEAANEKMAQLINSALITMAYEQRAETKKRIANINVAFAPDKKLAKTRDMNLVNAARAVISANGMGANKGWMFVDPMSHLDKIKAYEPEVYEVLAAAIAPVLRNSKPVEQMTLDEFNSFADIVDQMLTLSRSSKQMMVNGQMIERQEAVDAMVAAMEPHFTNKPRAGIDQDVRDLDKMKFDFGSWMSALRRVESWITEMDGGPVGAFRTYLYTPVREATEKYRTKSEFYLKKYRDLLAGVNWGKNEKIAAPEIGYTFTNGKASLLHALLHTGNSSNKQKLLIGRGWGQLTADGQLDSTLFDAFVDRMIEQGVLTKSDFDFVQGVWDLMESMKPAAQKAHKRLYGYNFSEITATPFINKFGTYAGGYVPASTDGYIVQDAAINEAQENLFGDGSFMWPTTGAGFTKERVAGYNKPLALDVRMLASHIDKALRFAYIQPAVQDAAKVVNNREFKAGMEKIDSTKIVDMLMPWLQRAASQVVDTPAKSKYLNRASRFFRWARSTAGMTIMFANVTNTIQQLTGFSIAALRVKPASLAKASIQYNISPIDSAKFITGSSEFMKNRNTTAVMDIQRDIKSIVLDPSMAARGKDFVRAHAYFMQTAAQSYVDNIVWMGAYRDATESGSEHTDAVRQADSAVRETQGSFNPEDVSAIEVGSPFYRMFMMFAGYFNMQFNILQTDFKNTIRQNGLRHGYGRLLYVYTMGFAIPAIVSELIVQAMRPDDDDEEESYANTAFQYLLMPQLRTATAMLPGVGSLGMSIVNQFDDKWYNDRLTLSPAFSVGDKAIGGAAAAYDLLTGEQFDEDVSKGDVREILTLMAVMTGLPPIAAAGRPIGYLMDVNSGAVEPDGPVDFARGLATGR